MHLTPNSTINKDKNQAGVAELNAYLGDIQNGGHHTLHTHTHRITHTLSALQLTTKKMIFENA